LCVNWFKVLQQVYVSLIVHLIVPLFFQRVVKEKLICNTNRVFYKKVGILLGECLTVKN
jgi:L-cystine uptake protein TcyP (sodium:dicarboxylate symporter family)